MKIKSESNKMFRFYFGNPGLTMSTTLTRSTPVLGKSGLTLKIMRVKVQDVDVWLDGDFPGCLDNVFNDGMQA